MTRSRKTTILLLALALILGGGGALWFLTDTAPPERTGGGAASPAVAAPVVEEEPDPEKERQGVGLTIQPAEVVDTTVAWPVHISLELVRAAHMPKAKGVKPLGTGRTAALRGKIQDKGERGVAAEIRFLGGANTGRVLRANAEGDFGATDLLPGIGIVKVSGPGIPGSVREVHLQQTKTEVLNLSHGLPGVMDGTVFGPGNEPLADVDVWCDGHHTKTNEEGKFFYPSMTPGVNLVLVLKKDGFAHHFQKVAVAAAGRMTPGRYRYALRPEASLQVTIPDRVGGPEKTQLLLLPSNTHVARDFPWWHVNPTEVIPGSSVRIDGLPAIKIAIRTFHDGALAEPADKRVTLRAGRVATETIRLKPAPTIYGVVRDTEGRFLQGARVTMEAPDRVGATMYHLGEMPSFLNTEVVPSFPVAFRETTTDDYGRYLLSAWPNVADGQYLMAESRDGELWGGLVVKPDTETKDREIDLTLEPIAVGSGRLSIDIPGRTQGVPVEVTLNGEPLDPGVVPLGVPLVIEDVAEGTWRLRATWNGRPIIGGAGYQEFQLRGDTEQSVHLPEGAIAGQDPDTLLRTGRHGS